MTSENKVNIISFQQVRKNTYLESKVIILCAIFANRALQLWNQLNHKFIKCLRNTQDINLIGYGRLGGQIALSFASQPWSGVVAI